MRTKVDKASASQVAVCGCGHREVAGTRLAVLSLMARHEREEHPQDMHVRAMLWQARKA